MAALAAAGHGKSRRAQVEAPAQTNSDGLDVSGGADRRRGRAQQSTASETSANQRAVKRSELSFSNSLQQNRGATERRRSNTPANNQQAPAAKQIQAVEKLKRRLPPPSQAVERKSLTRCEAPRDDTKFGLRRSQVERNESNLRHWSSATGPLEDLPIGSRSRLVGLPTVCKSLFQLKGGPPQTSAVPRGGHTCQARRRALTNKSVEVPARIKQVLVASRVSAAASQVAQRRPPRTTTSAAPSLSEPSAASRALLLSKAAPRRALSCNQLASRLSDQLKIAKTTASPAVTNSRVRQGLLFARRQCQLAPPFQSVEDLSTPISRRVPHFTPGRVNSQHLDKPIITRAAAKSHHQVVSPPRIVQKPSATPLKAIGKTGTRLISRSGDNKTRKLVVAAPASKRSLEVALHLHRRWSSLESSNQDDDDEDDLTSSPSSSSSSTLSSTDSACLLLASSQALDYLAPAATGCGTPINQQQAAGGGECRIGRRSSLQTRAAADAAVNQTRNQPKPQTTTRRTSEGNTRRRVEPAEGQNESVFPADGKSPKGRSRERHCKLAESSELNRANCELDNKDQARGNDCESLDVVDIVVKQPKRDCHFDTKPMPSGEHPIDSQPLDQTSRREFLGRNSFKSPALPVSYITSDNENEKPPQTKSMLLVDQSSQEKQLAEISIVAVCDRVDSNQVGCLKANPSTEIDQSVASSIALSQLATETPVKVQDMMMISDEHSDAKVTSQRWPMIEDTNINNNNHKIGLENVSDQTNAHHQPLGPLQAINCDQRKQLQSRENSDSNTNELKVAPVASQRQPTTQRTAPIPIRQEPIHDYYDLEPRPFARGKFAQVKRCVKIDTKECFAAKCIKKRRRLVDIRHEILLEIEALKLSSQTEHIVKIFEVYETPNEMILILEMASGGELQRVLDDEESISEPLVRKMVRQILEGLISLHDDQIVHLDLKPQNLLLTKPFPNGDIKLCDFGISRRITECEIREICGTPDYTAPEVLQYDPISLNTDMWSLGVVTYVLLSGYSPFGSENRQQTFCNITTCLLDFPSELFENVSPDAIDFVRKLIVLEPSQRLTSRQALSHRWFSQ